VERSVIEATDHRSPAKVVRIAWISYLDPYVFAGGGELHARTLVTAGQARGHRITVAGFLGSRVQRVLRRGHVHRRFNVDWDADLFVLSNIRNSPHLRVRFPTRVLDRVLSSGRTAILEDAYVDVCEFDMPCGGDTTRCTAGCDRTWARQLFSQTQVAAFVSPMHQRMINAVLAEAVPERQILSAPSVDVDQFRPLGLHRDIDVLYVGTVKRAKGYSALVDRFGPDRLTFVGKNALGEPMAGRYLGELPYDALPEIMNRARIFAHLPAWHEPMGRAVVEAALCGCEVVTNERVGVTSYPLSVWTDRSAVRGNADRFWQDLEAAVDWAQ
jgi:glycosyltransferase involved in cell wall biosynthesis